MATEMIQLKTLKEMYKTAEARATSLIRKEINAYAENKDIASSIEEFYSAREKAIKRIWESQWSNCKRNQVECVLKEAGISIEGLGHKAVNRLFREEILPRIEPLSLEWLKGKFGEDWKEYCLKKRQAKLRSIAKEEVLEKLTENILQDEDFIYVHLRKLLAEEILKDVKNEDVYELEEVETVGYHYKEELVNKGSFVRENLNTVSDFLYTYTGEEEDEGWGRTRHLMFNDKYEELASEATNSILLDHLWTRYYPNIESCLSEKTLELLKEQDVEELVQEDDFNEYFWFEYCDFGYDLLEKISEESFKDIERIAQKTFDLEADLQKYQVAEQQRLEALQKELEEKRKAAEKRKEEKRKKEEAAKQLAELKRTEATELFQGEYQTRISPHTKYVLHIGGTNTGKTYQALQKMKQANTGLYLAPLRLLALEVYDSLKSEGIQCGLKTGEEEKDLDRATHLACTVEMFEERVSYDVVVIDESQMIADTDRGFSWYRAITKANAKEVHIIGSHHSKDLLVNLVGEGNVEVNEYAREIPLVVENKVFSLKQAVPGDAIIVFSRKRVLETAAYLEKKGHQVSIVYGSMPPEARKKQIDRYINKESQILVSTDAIGMGLNLPVKRVAFLETEKFDGQSRRRLTSQEVKQIAGRAGRKGIYNEGRVAFSSDIKAMKYLLECKDTPINIFTIAPTSNIFHSFERRYRILDEFFKLWSHFDNPKGTRKAPLLQEKELYQLVKGTYLETRFSANELYNFLHLPFTANEADLRKQWLQTMKSIANNKEWPEPLIDKSNLDSLELSYKRVGLHLLFLYHLNKGTEAYYWERIRKEISDEIYNLLKKDLKKYQKKCKHCSKTLAYDYPYPMCNKCFESRYRRHYYDDFWY